MKYTSRFRPASWGAIAAYFLFCVAFFILTVLECNNIDISIETYRKILFIPELIGLILGFISGCIYEFKLHQMEKIKSDKEMKKIYHKEIFCFSIVTFISIALFFITCYVYISSQI